MKPLKQWTWAEWCMVTVPVFLLALPFLLRIPWQKASPFYQATQRSRDADCRGRLKHIYFALQFYSKDYDEHWPPATIGGVKVAGWSNLQPKAGVPPVGWADAIQLKVGGTSMFQCSNEPHYGGLSPNKTDYTDYWLNANLAGQKKANAYASNTILVGEGADGLDKTDATYSKSSLPPAWLSDPKSPAFRHLGGANYLMADGTIHWLQPQDVTTFGGRKNSFALE